ncbi:unnamed protein product [Rotaria sp. Silwood1]|nr:unnamed protein product [Rotaria sp. Silwood1]CAF3625509.1 unnamed protein product [Rotaria sp. Silwood1]CAF3662303.1 unnamed protein product [Rotaria sp. Silwood1]CAF4600671.1 unnamed protein product [Rotaria sp. Silwood1]CAF4737739.1 unnamed protein product [Rotaria sp. Silwood1]
MNPLSQINQHIVFRRLLSTDEKILTTFLESLSQRTRHYCVYPSYDKKTAELFCNEEINRNNDKLRLIALINKNTIVALFNITLSIRNDEYERFRINHKIELNNNNTARLSPCITDNYQNKYLGNYLMEKVIDIIRQMDKRYVILSGGVLVENTRAIHFFERNKFRLFSTTFLSHDGYECKDGLIEIDSQ